jgi:hypothetical protein
MFIRYVFLEKDVYKIYGNLLFCMHLKLNIPSVGKKNRLMLSESKCWEEWK